MSEQQEYWFAARTRKDQEFAIRNSLEKLNVECFMPTQFVIRQLKYRKPSCGSTCYQESDICSCYQRSCLVYNERL